ncbi:hypothetical protein ACJA25_01085 [Mycoplasmopsis hyopharyngis]|uniref:hypothetical protein n=1 Tax=Mycoplasmopsis hyopharyngis TaxID=29558 RepID=UPI003873B94E
MGKTQSNDNKITNKNAVKKLGIASIFFTTILMFVLLFTTLYPFASSQIPNNIVSFITTNDIIHYLYVGIGGLFLITFIIWMAYLDKKRKKDRWQKLDKTILFFSLLITPIILFFFGAYLVNWFLDKTNREEFVWIAEAFNFVKKSITNISLGLGIDEKLLVHTWVGIVLLVLFLIVLLSFSYMLGTSFYNKNEVKKPKTKNEKLLQKADSNVELEEKEEEKSVYKEMMNPSEKEEPRLFFRHDEQETQKEEIKVEPILVKEVEQEKIEPVVIQNKEVPTQEVEIIEQRKTQEVEVTPSVELEPEKVIEQVEQPKEEQKPEEPKIVYVTKTEVVDNQVDLHQVKINERKAYLLERYNENQEELSQGLYAKPVENKQTQEVEVEQQKPEEPKIVYVTKTEVIDNQVDLHQVKINERKAYLLERYNENQEELAQGLYSKPAKEIKLEPEQSKEFVIVEPIEKAPVVEEPKAKEVQPEEVKAIETIVLERKAIEQQDDVKEKAKPKKVVVDVNSSKVDEELQQVEVIASEPQKVKIAKAPKEPKPKKTTAKKATTKKATTKSTTTKKATTPRKRTVKKTSPDEITASQKATIIVNADPLEKDFSKLLNGGYEETKNPSVRVVENKRGSKVPKATAAQAKMSIEELLAAKAAEDAKLKKATKKSSTTKKVGDEQLEKELKKAAKTRSKLIEEKLTKLINLVDDLDLDELSKEK